MAQPASPMATPQPWNLVAPVYAEEVTPKLELYAIDALDLVAPPEGSRIVDVACGPGTLAMAAARRGYIVDAIDFSPSMIDHLAARAAMGGISGVKARQGDGEALPYADGTFAAGFSMFGLMFFGDRRKGFAELRRVIAHGGRGAVASWMGLDQIPVFAAMFAALQQAMASREGTAVAPPAPGDRDLPLSTQDRCHDEMSIAFRDVEVYKLVHEERYDSPEHLWASLERTVAPLVWMQHNLGAERWKPLADAALVAIVRELAGAPAVFSMPAWLTVGRAL